MGLSERKGARNCCAMFGGMVIPFANLAYRRYADAQAALARSSR
jgi:hypothetical protein